MPYPILSVIVTTHHRPHLLQRAINSLLAQTFNEFEIVLVSDEGSLETQKVALGNLRNSDIFLKCPAIKGPAASRNYGLQLARGKYLYFLDDDDSLLPDFFSNLVNRGAFERNLATYTNYEIIHEVRNNSSAQEVDRDYKEQLNLFSRDQLMVGNFIPNNTFVAPRAPLASLRFDEHLHSLEDWDFLLNLSNRVDFIHEPIKGPQIHLDANKSEGRNQESFISGTQGVDYITMYRKWPSENETQRARRVEVLKILAGIEIPESWV